MCTKIKIKRKKSLRVSEVSRFCMRGSIKQKQTSLMSTHVKGMSDGGSWNTSLGGHIVEGNCSKTNRDIPWKFLSRNAFALTFAKQKDLWDKKFVIKYFYVK